MTDRPWLGFGIVSGAGFALLLLSAFSAAVSPWQGMAGVLGIFLGWLIISGVFWLAAIPAAHTLAGGRPALSRQRVVAAGSFTAAGVQAVTYVIPNAAASLTWEPQSPLLTFMIAGASISGIGLVALGVGTAVWAFTKAARLRHRTSVRIRVMHMQGSWPVWFDNEVMDSRDSAPISEALKSRGKALAELFESSTKWDDPNSRYQWKSEILRNQYNLVSRTFAQDLAQELGPKWFVSTEVQRSRKLAVQFDFEIFAASLLSLPQQIRLMREPKAPQR